MLEPDIESIDDTENETNGSRTAAETAAEQSAPPVPAARRVDVTDNDAIWL
jgi:hypothetical protein